MPKSNAAIVSKARAMFGKRLTAADWENLLNCSSVSEAAAYLKSNTAYRTVLADIRENDVHRGEVETLLRAKIVRDTARLGHYDMSMGKGVGRFLVGSMEIRILLRNVIRVDAHQPSSERSAAPLLAGYTHVDVRALETAETFDQLVDALEGSAYQKLLLPFRLADGDFNDYTGLETVLYTRLYSDLYDVIDHNSTPTARQELHRLVDDYVDLENYARLIRLKAYYHVSESQLRASLLPFGSIPKQKLDEMIAADTPKQVTAVMEETRVGRRTLHLPYDTPDSLESLVRYRDAHKNIFFSSESSVVMLSYVFLMETELTGLINLVEGLRYGVPKAEIQRLLRPYNFG